MVDDDKLKAAGSRRENTAEGVRIVNSGAQVPLKTADWVKNATRNLQQYVATQIKSPRSDDQA